MARPASAIYFDKLMRTTPALRHKRCLWSQRGNYKMGFNVSVTWGIALTLILMSAILLPFLIKEIGKGKKQLTPTTPAGAGDVTHGTRSNPAPGQPDGQADPYSAAAHAETSSHSRRAS